VSIQGVQNCVTNSGVITGTYGVYLTSNATDTTGATAITNSGTISGVYYGVLQASSETIVINNSGLVLGGLEAAVK
jgi:type 1 fimbria pilin